MTYKGAIIAEDLFGGYNWLHPDYFDRSLEGEDWLTTGCGSAETIEECKEQIDEFLDDLC